MYKYVFISIHIICVKSYSANVKLKLGQLSTFLQSCTYMYKYRIFSIWIIKIFLQTHITNSHIHTHLYTPTYTLSTPLPPFLSHTHTHTSPLLPTPNPSHTHPSTPCSQRLNLDILNWHRASQFSTQYQEFLSCFSSL